MGNRIGKEMLSQLQEIMRCKPNLVSLCGITDDATEADLSGLGMSIDADDGTILASELPHKRALLTLIFGGDKDNPWDNTSPATLTVGMAEADFSSKNLAPAGAIIISAWISHKDKGAMTKFDISKCRLHAEGGKALAAGLKGNRVITELNIADNYLTSFGKDMSGIIALADAIPDMRALAKFDISNNSLCAAGAKALAEGLEGNQVMNELNLAGNNIGKESEEFRAKADMSGIIALAGIISGMGALAKLDMSTNYIGAEQEEDLQRICMAGGIELTQ
jgi:hypothetical protein